MRDLQIMKAVKIIVVIVGMIAVLLVAALPALAADEWKPIDPAHLAMKAPVVEKDADAEVVLWEMRIEKESDRATISHYVRVKIFSERGRDSQGTVEIPYYNGVKIKDVAGRTIKADGQIVD